MTEDELEGMLVENSDEPYAAEIAQQVMKKLRQGEMIDTTTKLYETIEEALSIHSGERTERGSEKVMPENFSGTSNRCK